LGQYHNEVKQGFGIYRWPDNRLYKGYWKDGQQHGFAEIETQAKDGQETQERRYTRWEEGKRVQTFDISFNSGLAIDKQLKAEQEKLLEEDYEKFSGMTFSSPLKFFENLSKVIEEVI
jgi:ribosomal protein S4